jgi:hypothetical protein
MISAALRTPSFFWGLSQVRTFWHLLRATKAHVGVGNGHPQVGIEKEVGKNAWMEVTRS